MCKACCCLPAPPWACPALPALEPSNSQWMVLEAASCYCIPCTGPAGPGLRDRHGTTSTGSTGYHRICSIQPRAPSTGKGTQCSQGRISPLEAEMWPTAQAVTITGSKQCGTGRGGECEASTLPPCSGETSDRVTAGPSPFQAVGFIELLTQLFPIPPLSHMNSKKAWIS